MHLSLPSELKNILIGNPKIAVIGASNNPEKYGFRIFKNLKDKGFEVYPINNREEEIQGKKAYKSIEELPQKVDIINFVVPEIVGMEIAKNAKSLGYKNLWFQPGSFGEKTLELFQNDPEINLIAGPCIMVETDRL